MEMSEKIPWILDLALSIILLVCLLVTVFQLRKIQIHLKSFQGIRDKESAKNGNTYGVSNTKPKETQDDDLDSLRRSLAHVHREIVDQQIVIENKEEEIETLKETLREKEEKQEKKLETLKASLNALVKEKEENQKLKEFMSSLEKEKNEEFLAMKAAIESVANEKKAAEKQKADLDALLFNKYQELEKLKESIEDMEKEKSKSENELIEVLAEKEKQLRKLQNYQRVLDKEDL